MLNLKLKTIASLIDSSDIVIDTCCDHAYLAIYLKKNNLCKEVYASDISINALNNAKKNITKEKVNIKTYLSDGFKDIFINDLTTAVIAGVGTFTALSIVDSAPQNLKFIISSNNEHKVLRKEMKKRKYYLEQEMVVKENSKYYPIMLFTKNYKFQNKFIIKYGLSKNIEYFKYLLNKEYNILSKIPKRYVYKRFTIKLNIQHLKNTIKRNLDY